MRKNKKESLFFYAKRLGVNNLHPPPLFAGGVMGTMGAVLFSVASADRSVFGSMFGLFFFVCSGGAGGFASFFPRAPSGA